MGTQENIALFRRVVDELVNNGNVAAVDELMTPDFVEHETLPPGLPAGREGVKQLFTLLHTAFPDLHGDIEDVVAAGDKVVFRMTWRGVQTGQFFDISPTGKRVAFDVFDMARVEGGKMVEHWGLSNQLSLLQQLGVVPVPDSERRQHIPLLSS